MNAAGFDFREMSKQRSEDLFEQPTRRRVPVSKSSSDMVQTIRRLGSDGLGSDRLGVRELRVRDRAFHRGILHSGFSSSRAAR